ncbi:hypothetical protein SAMN05444396_11179 [Flavobacterium segetis]|jgi:hypothetical protein|uniref:Uncharacterized protein n=1 Tax=Flavobacterium segetis TaxID=271157 RepID=A0A1M5JL29_9FLAO|nr:hypothetical protein SAMN05444396_11179 [Flavobacterium segetis]
MLESYELIEKNEDKIKIELNVFKYFVRLLDYGGLRSNFDSIKLDSYKSTKIVFY